MFGNNQTMSAYNNFKEGTMMTTRMKKFATTTTTTTTDDSINVDHLQLMKKEEYGIGETMDHIQV